MILRLVNKTNAKIFLASLWVICFFLPFIVLINPKAYFLNVHSAGNFFASWVVAATSLFILKNEDMQHERFYFSLFSVSLFLWLWAEAFGYCCAKGEPLVAAMWFRISNVGVILAAANFYVFVAYFLKQKRPILIVGAYLFAGFFIMKNIFSNYFGDNVRWYFWGYYPQWDIYRTVPFFVYFSSFINLALLELLHANIKSKDPYAQRQLKWLSIGFILCYLGSIDFLPAFGYPVYPCGYIAVLVWWAMIVYSIHKYHVMDINFVLRKTLLYSLVSAALVSLYVGVITLLAQLLGGHYEKIIAFPSAIAALVITLIFNPLRLKIQHWLDRWLPGGRIDPLLLQETASGFAHEMKRPLSKISLPAELALFDIRSVKNGEKSWLDILPSLEERLGFIIHQSIDAGYKLEAIRELSVSSVRSSEMSLIQDVVRVTINQEKEMLQSANVSLKIAISQKLLAVCCSVKRLEIVLINLIRNAVEAMESSDSVLQRKLVIEAEAMGTMIEVRVKDNGPGIATETLERIFEPNFTTKGTRGTGMGLYLCQQLIHACGGTISARSKENQGAEFVVCLPAFKPTNTI